MKIFLIRLEETIVNVAEVQVMAEDEPSARSIAMNSASAVWDEADRVTVVGHVEEQLDSDELQWL